MSNNNLADEIIGGEIFYQGCEVYLLMHEGFPGHDRK